MDMKDFYSNKKVLVTGATGFKGSWMSIWLQMLGANVFGYSLAPQNRNDNYISSGVDELITHQTDDIRDRKKLEQFIEEVQPDIVFHLAAQPLVLYSYDNPLETYETNVMGTANLLNAIRKVGSVKACVIITTDKVYQNDGGGEDYKEEDRLGGYDPYSSSKACCELLTTSFEASFFSKSECNVISARAGNVIGGGDWAENRIVPDFFRAKKTDQKLTIRNPEAIRPWQFVLEPLKGYLMLGKYAYESDQKVNGAWNFGPIKNDAFTVKNLISALKNLTEVETQFLNAEGLKESKILKLDSTKAYNTIGWKPTLSFEQTVEFTNAGYISELRNENVLENRKKQIIQFENLS